MFRILCVLLLFFYCHFAHSQTDTKRIESVSKKLRTDAITAVKTILSQSGLSDSQKVDSSLNMMSSVYHNVPSSVESGAVELYNFTLKINNREEQARALFYLGKAQMALNKVDSDTSLIRAAAYFDELNRIEKEIECLNYLIQHAVRGSDDSKFHLYLSESYSKLKKLSKTSEKGRNVYFLFHQNMGGTFLKYNEIDSALYHYSFARQYAELLNDDRKLAQCYLNIGNLYDRQDKFVKAFEFWLKCKKIAIKMDDLDLQCNVAMSIGQTYVYLGEVNSSIRPFEEAAVLAAQSNNTQLQILALIKLVKGKFHQQKFEEALQILQNGENLIKSGVGTELKFEIYLYEGACFMNLSQFQKAEKMFQLAQSESKKYGNEIRNSTLLMNMAVLHYLQEQYTEALKLFNNSRKYEIEMGSYEIRSEASRYMHNIYLLMGDKSRALEMLQNYTSEKDTLAKRDAKSQIMAMDLESNFQFQQIQDSISFANQIEIQSALTQAKDESIKRKNSELEVKRNQQYLLYGGIGFLGLFVLFLYNRFRVTNRQNKIIDKQKDKNLFLSQKILEQDQQLILGETAKTVAHELNSPLGAIKAGAEGLQYLMDELVNNLLPTSSKEDLDMASQLSNYQEADSYSGFSMKIKKSKELEEALKNRFGVESESSKTLASELTELQIVNPDEQIINFLVGCQDRQPIYKLARCIGQIKMISQTTISATNKSADVVSSVREALDFQSAEDFEDIRLHESISSVVTIIETNINEKGTFINDIDAEVYLSSVNEFKTFQLWYNLMVFLVEESEAPMKIHVTAKENDGFTQVQFSLNQSIQSHSLNEHHYNIIMNAKRDSNDLRIGIVKYLLSEKDMNIETKASENQTVFTIDFPIKKS